MVIGFIGAGKVGVTLGTYFVQHQIHVSGYCSKTEASAAFAADATGTKQYNHMESLIADSDVIFLTVPDGAIPSVWDSMKHISFSNKMICHCSGALSSAVFSEIEQKQSFGYSIHPLYAISGKGDSDESLSNAFFTIEGASEHLAFWQDFFQRLGNPAEVISADCKGKYHAAAVFVSNFVTGLFFTGTSLLQQCGFPPDCAGKALLPLFLDNARTLARKDPVQALTGPVERADLETVRKHLSVLGDEERALYALMSEILLKLAREKHPERQDNYDALESVLTGFEEADSQSLQREEQAAGRQK